jgi:Predicted membrane protein
MQAETELEDQRELLNITNYQEKYIKTSKTRIIETEMSSYLPLQILIYYNRYYSFLMTLILISMFAYKTLYFGYGQLYDLIIIILFEIMELSRLYFGNSGNINESFPELIAFIIISVIFSIPLLAYLFVLVTIAFPMDRAVCIVQAIFLIFELTFVIITIRKLVKNQTAIFFIRNSQPDSYYRVKII